jgi:RING finger protein 113A
LDLDRDWEIDTKGKKLVGKTVASVNKSGPAGDDEDDTFLKSIPFACVICKNPHTNLMVTKWGHYFCESCALPRHGKNPSYVAGGGRLFDVTKRLNWLLDKKGGGRRNGEKEPLRMVKRLRRRRRKAEGK